MYILQNSSHASLPCQCRHILTVLRGLPRLTSLTVREEIPAGEEGSPCSHETCALTPTSCSALAHSLKHLVHLEWQGMLTAPHPSSLQVGALEQICRAVGGRAEWPWGGAADEAQICACAVPDHWHPCVGFTSHGANGACGHVLTGPWVTSRDSACCWT